MNFFKRLFGKKEPEQEPINAPIAPAPVVEAPEEEPVSKYPRITNLEQEEELLDKTLDGHHQYYIEVGDKLLMMCIVYRRWKHAQEDQHDKGWALHVYPASPKALRADDVIFTADIPKDKRYVQGLGQNGTATQRKFVYETFSKLIHQKRVYVGTNMTGILFDKFLNDISFR